MSDGFWSGRVTLLTGASRGIGRALALDLADRGALVHACARDASSLPHHDNLRPAGVDISDAVAVQTWVDAVGAERGRLDVVVHNASILGPRATLDQTDVEAFDDALDINTHGTFYVTRASIPWLERSDSTARVIFMSSSVGRKGRAAWGAYSVSKFGAEALMQILADEKPDWLVASLNPGGTATDMRAEAYPDEDPATLPTAQDVAGTARRLLETLTSEQHGQVFNSRDML